MARVVYVLKMDMGGDDPYEYIKGVTDSLEKAKAREKSNELYAQTYEEFVIE